MMTTCKITMKEQVLNKAKAVDILFGLCRRVKLTDFENKYKGD